MKKLFTFLAGAALLGSLSACSSDEPAKGPDGLAEGNTMYLNVRISSAGDISRADEGDLQPGDDNEHAVSDAYFFFFDKDGIFLTEASVWKAGATEDSENNNVELTSDNVVVLKNLTDENLPKYMLTVLNAPQALLTYIRGGVRTIDEVRNFHNGLGIRETPDKTNDAGIVTGVNTSNFVMSTSSFYPGNQEYKDAANTILCRHDDAYYYANVLESTDFYKDPTAAASATPIDIYVERLAAKFTISGLTAANTFKIRVTVAGEGNTGNEETGNVAATDVWVKINNFGVTCVENESYLSKNLDGFSSSSSNLWTGWNDATKHRSFWGKSVSYGKSADELDLYAPTYATVKGSLSNGAIYSPESTNEPSKIRVTSASASQLQPRSVTNIVFTATTYSDKDCTKPLDLILYGGVYYKKEQFYKYILSRLNGKGSLNYYKYTGTDPIETESYEGSVDNFVQVSSDDITRIKYGNETGEIGLKTNIGDDTQLWAKSTTNEKTVFTKIENGVSELNKALNSFFSADHPTSYTGGATVYYVPVEHLLGKNWGSADGQTTRIVTNEGEFGVVRNHWYEIEVTGLMNMGYGVFDPSEDSTETLRPKDPTKETYALGARIKILSWKLVKQSVVL